MVAHILYPNFVSWTHDHQLSMTAMTNVCKVLSSGIDCVHAFIVVERQTCVRRNIPKKSVNGTKSM